MKQKISRDRLWYRENPEAKIQVIKAWETVYGNGLGWERWHDVSLGLSFLLLRSLSVGQRVGKQLLSYDSLD